MHNHTHDHGPNLRLRSLVAGECFYLLISLLLLILLYPFLQTSEAGHTVLGLLNTGSLLAAIHACRVSRRALIIAIILAITPLVAHWLVILNYDPIFTGVLALSLAVFYLYITVNVLLHVLQGDDVDADKIYGAAAAYILLGFMWASLYAFVEYMRPDSFRLDHVHNEHEHLELFSLIYFSFTTLTSTGFGDIVPLTPHARSLTIIEQITGIFYVAILIARLAGLYPPKSARRARQSEHHGHEH